MSSLNNLRKIIFRAVIKKTENRMRFELKKFKNHKNVYFYVVKSTKK
jgi:hypothetical protein